MSSHHLRTLRQLEEDERRLEEARFKALEAAKAQRTARARERQAKQEEKEKQEARKNAEHQRWKTVVDAKEKHRMESDLWKQRYSAKNLEGYCLDV